MSPVTVAGDQTEATLDPVTLDPEQLADLTLGPDHLADLTLTPVQLADKILDPAPGDPVYQPDKDAKCAGEGAQIDICKADGAHYLN